MNFLTPQPRFFVLSAGIVFLTACGGGGGDSDEGTTSLQLDPANYGETPIPIREFGDYEGAGDVYAEVLAAQDLIQEVGFRLESVNYGGSASVEPGFCAESNGNLVIKEESTDTREYIEYRFTDCLVPGAGERIRLDGTVVNDLRFSKEGRQVEIRESYDVRGSIGEPARELAIVGGQTITGVQSSESQFELTGRSPALEYLVGERYVAIRNMQIDMTESSSGSTMNMTSDLVSSDLGGYVTLATPETVHYASYQDCPVKGRIEISGDGKLEVRYGQSSGNGRGVEVLLNGSVVEYLDSCSGSLPGNV